MLELKIENFGRNLSLNENIHIDIVEDCGFFQNNFNLQVKSRGSLVGSVTKVDS